SLFSQYTDFIGDFNGDGYDDIFVAAPTFRQNDEEIGKLYVYSINKVNGIKEIKNNVINGFKLLPCFPNPFNNRTIIPFKLITSSEVQIAIYDICGRLIKTLFSGQKRAGMHKITWNGKTNAGKEAASGVYFVVLKHKNSNLNIYSQKIVLLK
ncbi:MAG: T9SS C-terminal target domain-containing protein, partial [Calditrichaeota bacterium]